jgi:hypothetical protein
VTLITSKLRTAVISLNVKWWNYDDISLESMELLFWLCSPKTEQKEHATLASVDLPINIMQQADLDVYFRVTGDYNRLWNSVYLLFRKEPCDDEIKYSYQITSNNFKILAEKTKLVGSSVNDSDLHLRMAGLNLGRETDYPDDVFRGFPQSVQENVWIVS